MKCSEHVGRSQFLDTEFWVETNTSVAAAAGETGSEASRKQSKYGALIEKLSRVICRCQRGCEEEQNHLNRINNSTISRDSGTT